MMKNSWLNLWIFLSSETEIVFICAAAPSRENSLLQTKRKKKLHNCIRFFLKEGKAEITEPGINAVTVAADLKLLSRSLWRTHCWERSGTLSSSSDLTAKLIIQAESSWLKGPYRELEMWSHSWYIVPSAGDVVGFLRRSASPRSKSQSAKL